MFSEDKKEPFFIKNIESVQGDERDVIIFSIGYGKDINGNMSMNFGPLSRSGGYRRLNVAITRAKYNVKVVSSIEPSDIDLSRTNAEGVRMLKSYMEFAKAGYVYKEDEDIKAELNSTVEKSIYDLLINNGYKVDTYVGTSEYKINIAVKSPTDENKYILAIELDGCEYGIEPIARERYRLREELLYSMGWNFYRIWSTEWVRNREKVESEILTYLEENRMFLEELIVQHKKMNVLCPTSVNTLRIMTFANNDKAEILYAALRVGNGVYEVDNFHKGGMGVSIDTKTGKLKGCAIDKDLNEFKMHPLTRTHFNKFELPYWKETKKLVLDAALVNQNIKVVGWDVAITKDGPILVEGNRRPGFDLVQVLSKKGRKDIMYHVLNRLKEDK